MKDNKRAPIRRALLVGFGSIGQRHFTNLKNILPDAQVCVWRHRKTERESVANLSIQPEKIVYDWDDVKQWAPDIALVTGPASSHIQVALKLAQQGVHLFIEKPLSDSDHGVNDLIDLCRHKEIVLQVGYNLRFTASLLALKQAINQGLIGKIFAVKAEVGQYLPDWRPSIDYRQTVSACKELGGGVINELSHELDYVRWLIGEVRHISAFSGQVSDLDINVEDIAQICLRFDNNVIGTIHLDFLQRIPTRICKVIGSEGTLIWDGISHQVQIGKSGSHRFEELPFKKSQDKNQSYIDELAHFIECVKNGADPLVTGEDGLRVIELIIATKASALEQRVVEL